MQRITWIIFFTSLIFANGYSYNLITPDFEMDEEENEGIMLINQVMDYEKKEDMIHDHMFGSFSKQTKEMKEEGINDEESFNKEKIAYEEEKRDYNKIDDDQKEVEHE